MATKESDVVNMGDTNMNPDPNEGKDKGKATEAPKEVELDLGGTKFKVPAAVAAALEGARTEAKTATEKASDVETRLTAQLEELRAKLPAPKADDANDPLAGIETEIFADPKSAAKKIIEIAKQLATGEIAQQNAATNAQTAFWNSFYEEYPELKEDDLVVKAVMNREMASLRPLKVADAIKKLGQDTQKYLLDRGVKREKPKKGKELEGGNERGPRKPNASTESEGSQPAGGISAVLRARREARRASRTQVGAS